MKDKAKKFDKGKPRMDLLSRDWMLAVAKVLTFGANKYGAHNWRSGMEWSRLYAATLRHLTAHMDGETLDQETGMSHLWHASCCLMFLTEYEARGLGTDDRFMRNEKIINVFDESKEEPTVKAALGTDDEVWFQGELINKKEIGLK